MAAKTNRSLASSKSDKDLANLEITESLQLLRQEQKREREQNKTLKNELKKLVSELFSYPELRSKANRLLDRAVEAATQELTTKNFSQTKLNLETKLSRPKKTQDENQDPSEIEADNEESCSSELDRGSYEELEITEREELEELTIEVSDEQSIQLCEDNEIEIEEKSLAEEEFSNESEIADLESNTVLFEDFIWQQEDNMAKNIFEANEQLLKAQIDDIENAEIMQRTVYENPFELNAEVSKSLPKVNAQKSVTWKSEIEKIVSEISEGIGDGLAFTVEEEEVANTLALEASLLTNRTEATEKFVDVTEIDSIENTEFVSVQTEGDGLAFTVEDVITEPGKEEEECNTLALEASSLTNRTEATEKFVDITEMDSMDKNEFVSVRSLNESEPSVAFINNEDNLLYDMLSDVYQVEDSYTPTEKESTHNIDTFSFNNDEESESKSIGIKCPDFKEQASDDSL